jgi:response regulator RpfG family c-di-GMP phosphodiesterase
VTLKTKLVCDVLVRDGLIKPEQAQAATARLQWSGERIEEAVLDLGLLSEADLLRSLAAYYKANFISAEKLAKAEVARSLLDTIPQRFAEKVGVCPVVYDAKSHVLSVVTADPDDLESLRELQLASGAREVRAVLARPAAVKALIAKAYGGDGRAFASFERYVHVAAGPVVYERSSAPERKSDARSHGGGERTFDEKDFERQSAPKAPPPPPPPAPPTAPPKPKVEPAAAAPPQAEGTMTASSFLELFHILVNLLEGPRGDLRGHSAVVARLMRRMGEKLGLEGSQIGVLVAAAFIHDLGKMGTYHLTTLNCSEYDGHKVAAQKAFGVPGRLLEPVHLPNDALEAVAHMYERYDGKGFPDGVAGKEIPLAARVLAICDTYADLTNNPRNPFRATLSPEDACAALAKHRETIFDPNLVDLFKNNVLGEERAARLLATRMAALIVDVDPEEATILELRMSEQGFVVKMARTSEQALKVLAEGKTDLVVSEIDLGPDDGLALLAAARAESWGKDVPWVIHTRRQDRAVAQRAFELGVFDYVTKPAPADVLVAKLKALLEQRAAPGKSGGVSGSLKEMGLPDMVQVLFHSRKSGSLKIRAREGAGEIHFNEGDMVDALWRELRGEEAFYAMLKVSEGDFSLDPTFRTTARTINQSSEALLLEGMRRMDEGLG